MKELEEIVKTFARLELGEVAALATVLKVKGSTYRRPGAKMLVLSSGVTVGSVSGGCLESDVRERAQKVIATGHPIVVTYDSTQEGDEIYGLGLGCNGVVHLLIERIAAGDPEGPLAFLTRCLERRQAGVIATLLRVEGLPSVGVGAHLMLNQDGVLVGDIAHEELAQLLSVEMRNALCDGRSRIREWQLTASSIEAFIEAIPAPVPLVIFGAGHDAIPLAAFAKQLGWHVTVIDHRAAFATADRFPTADQVVCARPEELQAHILLEQRTVAMIMTHNYLADRDLLKPLLAAPLRYLGILGPRSRTERLLRELQAEGVAIDNDHLRHLHGPAGLDIGAETPEEIALSILAEMQAALTGRGGGMLKDSPGPIHVPAQVSSTDEKQMPQQD